MRTRNGRFKTHAQCVFRELLQARGIAHCALKGCSAAAASRLYHGIGHPNAGFVVRAAKQLGRDGRRLVQAWLQDKADGLPVHYKISVLVE